VFFVALLHLAGLLTLELAILTNAAMAVVFGMLMVVRLIHRGSIEQVAPERQMAIRGELQKMLRSTQIASICVIATAKIQFFLMDVLSDSAQLGAFAAAHRYSMVASILTVAATTVLMPLAAAVDSRAAFDRYRSASWRLSACLAFPVLALVLFADPILPLLFGTEFDVAVVPAQIMLLGLVLSMFVTPLSYTFYNASAAPALAWLNAGQLVFSCVVGLLLIPTYGAIGAAWVSLGVNVLGLAVILTVAASVSRRLN
jgi:O-antigen/teichoic acid export membrane protein